MSSSGNEGEEDGEDEDGEISTFLKFKNACFLDHRIRDLPEVCSTCQPLSSDFANPTMPVLEKSVPSSIHSGAPPTNKIKSKERKVHFKDDEGRASNLEPSGSAKHKNVRGVQQRKDAASEGGNIAPQPMVNAASTMCHEELHPIWFSLVASDSQEGDAHLPQIPSGYVRVKNANLPVSFIQKYVAKKLNLYSEAEPNNVLNKPLRFYCNYLSRHWFGLEAFPNLGAP